uniref:CXXC motif containing zinc binding protein n=1 Tax=Ursus maritimus TaxID=29073 RepID=A0A452VBI7_URSMA
MGKIALQLKATLENVTNLRPLGEDFRWYLKMKCGNCGEISEKWQYIRLMDSVALKGGRGSASMVQKCKLCARENSIEILRSTIQSYNAEDNEKFKTVVEFECPGLEPVDFQPQAGFAAEGVESGTVFSDINLQEKVPCVPGPRTCSFLHLTEQSFSGPPSASRSIQAVTPRVQSTAQLESK